MQVAQNYGYILAVVNEHERETESRTKELRHLLFS